jgi:hypothetical protein
MLKRWGLVLTVVAAGCSAQLPPLSPATTVGGSAGGSATPTNSQSPPSGSATTSTGGPMPSASAEQVSLEALTAVTSDVDRALAICDDDPDPNDLDGGRPLTCPDVVRDLGRAIATVGEVSVRRLHVQRRGCNRCDPTRSNRADGYAEDASGNSWHLAFNGLVETLGVERIEGPIPWPDGGPIPAPPVGRAPLDRPTPGLADRPALPFCGVHDVGAIRPDERPLSCFRESAVARRPAEILLIAYGTEGGKESTLLRFLGSGPIAQYTQDATRNWSKANVMMILALPPSGSWSPSAFST